MPTYQVVDRVLPAGAGAATVTRNATDEAIAAIPSLLAWFDPSTTPPYVEGSSGPSFRLKDKRFGVLARAAVSNRPAASTINEEPALSFGADGTGVTSGTNGSVIMDDVLLLGSPDYTVAFGCEVLAAGAGYLIGTAVAAGTFGVNFDSMGRMSVGNNVEAGFTIRTPSGYRGQRLVGVLGYTAETGAMSLRINGATVGTATTTLVPASRRLRLGGYGVPGTNSGTGVDLRMGQLLTFAADLTAAGRGTQLGLVEGRLRGLYGV
jgi:hypothetical protein